MDERGIAAGSLLHHDRLWPVGLFEIASLLFDEIKGFLPADALPGILAPVLPGAFQGVLQTVFGIHALDKV